MRMFRIFKGLFVWPQNKTDQVLLDCTNHETVATKISFSVRCRRGTLFCEFVKDVDAEFDPWPKESTFARMRLGRS